MTTFQTLTPGCVLCEHESEQRVLTSTSSFGGSDLDMRPAEPARSALWLRIQECPGCGYCAPEIGAATPWTRDAVESDDYRKQRRDDRFPDLANRFLCNALALAAENDDAEREYAAGLAASPDDTVRAILLYGQRLVDADDDGAHSIADALG